MTAGADDTALVQAYLNHVRVEKRLAERTVALYTLDLEKLTAQAREAGVALKAVQNPHIRRWVAQMHGAGRTARGIALDPLGLARVLCVARSPGPDRPQPGARRARSQSRQAAAQGIGGG